MHSVRADSSGGYINALCCRGDCCCGRISIFLHEYQKYTPELYAEMQNYIVANDAQLYSSMQSISIDHALMEKSDKINVVPVDFEWFDVGNLEIFLTLQQSVHSNASSANVIEINAKNNLISSSSGKIITLLGVDDVCEPSSISCC